MRPDRARLLSGIASLLWLLLPLPAAAQPGLAPSLRRQIETLGAEKRDRTPAQRKIGSALLYAARLERGRLAAPGVASLRAPLARDAQGRAEVELRAEVTPDLLEAIGAAGGAVRGAHPRYGRVRADLPLDALEALAARGDVRSIRPAWPDVVHMLDVTEGDVAHRADLLRSTLGVDGTGVAVGVMANGVDSLAAVQATGDLPPTVTVIPGQAGSGTEGTAMLEIVHDIAPGADLLFARATGGEAIFAANIEALRAAGADVIVDDVRNIAEPVFQDGIVAQAVTAVSDDGALYFSSAGNLGNANDNTSGTWEGDWSDSGTTVNGLPAHEFLVGNVFNRLVRDPPTAVTLQWSDPSGASGNDYDLYLVDPSQTAIVAASTDVQDGDDDPFEGILSIGIDHDEHHLVVVQSGGLPRMLSLNSLGGRLVYRTDGEIFGHAAAAEAIAVGAVDVDDAGGAGGEFDGSESVQGYSSDGPRQIFYHPDGTPITLGQVTEGGGTVRPKPELSAADCVSTSTPGFGNFCGTSAAAPHAAAIAALLLEAGGVAATRETVLDALRETALDIEAAGVDRDSGAGIVDALAAGLAIASDACDDAVDNDSDGLTDHPDDPGCDSPDDPSEHSGALVCDDGLDNDGDGAGDHPDDVGCSALDSTQTLENPECQDGIDNDGALGTDFDGGASLNGGVPFDDPDPQCVGKPFRDREAPKSGCGLGAELALALAGLAGIRGARIRRGGDR